MILPVILYVPFFILYFGYYSHNKYFEIIILYIVNLFINASFFNYMYCINK